jgi:DNA repair protein RadC
METSPSVSLKSASEDRDTVGVASFDQEIVQRVLTVGVRAASVVDLLAIGLSRREEDVPLAEVPSRRMLQRFRSLRGLAEASKSDIQAATGFDDFEALRTMGLMELGRRMNHAGKGPGDTIDSADDIMSMFDHLRYEKREHFLAVLLDAKSNVIRTAVIHVGTLTMSVVGAREVFREAISDGAASIIVVHNHPSGDPTPSPEDLDVTSRLVEIGDLLDIPVVDHVIIGERKHSSLNAMGLMKAPRI